MPPIDTAALRRLYDAATPGTWVAFENDSYCEIRFDHGQIGDTCASEFNDPLGFDRKDRMRSNANLIAAVHNAMPALLNELEALRARVTPATPPLGECDLCGEQSAWMGKGVRCEECGEGIYQEVDNAQ